MIVIKLNGQLIKNKKYSIIKTTSLHITEAYLVQIYQSTFLSDSLSLSWIGYMYIVSLKDEMMDIHFFRLQDEICDLSGLRGHFQSVWITLKGGGVHQNILTGESLSLRANIPSTHVPCLDWIIFFSPIIFISITCPDLWHSVAEEQSRFTLHPVCDASYKFCLAKDTITVGIQ